jgi:PPP family 3-phenylpropionic acid transporter
VSLPRTVRTSAAYVAAFAGVGAAFPYLPVFYRSLGFDLAAVGFFAALSAAIALVASPVWGSIADRFGGSRTVIPVAALVAAAAAIVLSLAREPAMVIVGIVVLFAAGAGIVPVLDAHALEVVASDRDRYGRLRVWGSISFIVAVLLVGWIVDRLGIASLFLVYVPALLATALVTLTFSRVPRGAPTARLERLSSVLREADLMRFILAALIAWASVMAVNLFFSIHLTTLGAPGVLVGSAWALGALVEVPIMWAFPAIAARVGAERLLIVGAALFAARALVIAFVADPVILVATMVLAGGGFGLMLVAGITYVSRLAPPGAEATTQGVFSGMVFGLAIILGAGVGGTLSGWLGIPGMALIAAVGCLASIAAYAYAIRSAQSRSVVSSSWRPSSSVR